MRFVYGCLTVVLTAGYLAAQSVPALPIPVRQVITPALLATHVSALAHDSLEGRATGSPGELKAARYVAGQFRRLGLCPVDSGPGPDAYFQPYTIHQRGWGPVFLRTNRRQYRLYQDFYVNGLPNAPAPETLPVAFGGYGIDADTYADYTRLDVRGKAVVLWEGEPRDRVGRYRLSGTDQPSRWSDDAYAWQRKVKAARQRGARCVLIISSARRAAFGTEMQRRRVLSQRINKAGLEPVDEKPGEVAAYVISDSLAADVLGVSVRQLTRWQRQADAQGRSPAQSVASVLTLQSARQDFPLHTRNVLGWIRGSEHPEEVLVLSAHLDHLGKTAAGVVFNGADDDASGVAGVLAIAGAFAEAQKGGHSPRRSVLFALFSGEETGLWGSQYYVTHPCWSLPQTVCDLNIDMIGRADSAHMEGIPSVYTLGSDRLSAELRQVSDEAANQQGGRLTLDYRFDHDDPQSFFTRSDHYSFARFNVPVIHYFTGLHPDYHQPTDDAERLCYDRQAIVVQLILQTAWTVTNKPERIHVDKR